MDHLPADAPAPIEPRLVNGDRAELAALLARVGTGDRRAFELLYQRTAAKLLGVASRICWERAQAEEAVQETYLAIWRRAASFDPARGTATAWPWAPAGRSRPSRPSSAS